jgi:hypothetical protein
VNKLTKILMQVAELEYMDGQLTCDRNKPVFIQLMEPQKEQ